MRISIIFTRWWCWGEQPHYTWTVFHSFNRSVSQPHQSVFIVSFTVTRRSPSILIQTSLMLTKQLDFKAIMIVARISIWWRDNASYRGHPDISIWSTAVSIIIIIIIIRSDAVITVHVSAYIPQNHIEDEQNGKNEKSYEDRFSDRRYKRLHVSSGAQISDLLLTSAQIFHIFCPRAPCKPWPWIHVGRV